MAAQSAKIEAGQVHLRKEILNGRNSTFAAQRW
jgi:hypothetical protein